MCRNEIDVQLCAFEAAFPFLKAAMDAGSLEREVSGFRAELVPQAADDAERSEIEARLAAAMRS